MTSREEIAARLRESGNWLDGKDTSSMREAIYLIDLDVKAPQGREFSLLFNRLADPIDPTCKDVSETPKEGFTPVPFFKCSECGCQHIAPEYVRYCPNCGARVVRDD